MAHQRRSPQQRTPPTTSLTPSSRRKYPLRRAHSRTSSRSLVSESISSPIVHRPVLVPLHNLRRLQSRALLPDNGTEKDTRMRESSHPVQVGVKRKRVASTNENAHGHGRPTRSSHKRKRSTTTITKHYASTSEDSEPEASEMELDPPSRQCPNQTDSEEEMEGDEEDEDQEDEEEDDSTDDYLLYSAQYSQLNRLKKGDLVRLYKVGNLPEDPELMTKAEIIQVILDARDEETASLPPSSPPGRSSDYSSDDGNVAGDEEEEPSSGSHPSPLRRRVTMNTIVKSPPRPIKGRSMSLGNVLQSNANGAVPSLKRKGSLRINTETLSKQRSSNRSSPSTSAAATSTVGRTFPFHQLRSRKVSAPTPVDVRTPTSANSKGKGKGKAKQVEFTDEAAPTKSATKSGSSSKRQSKEKQRDVQLVVAVADESDLTEFDELPQPSPRRLRSKDRERPRSSQDSQYDPESTPTAKRKGKVRAQPRSSDEQARGAQKPVRITPMRRAKGKVKSLRESDLEVPSQEEGEEEEEDGEEESEEELEEAQQEEEEGDEEEAEEPEDVDEENEVDELVSTASLTPPPPSKKVRRTPMRQRLRQRRGNSCEANQGDDEYEEEEEVDEAEPLDADDDDEITIAVEEPRRLRNGKVVGDEDVSMESAEEIIEEDESGVDDEAEEEVEESDQVIEEEPDEDEAMEDDDVDLTAATTKSLTRLRKDDLVRLCESRNLEPVGNKRELAEALLQWRDRHVNGFSSPSSTGTVRPPSTTRRGRKKRSSASTVPVLLRSHQIHTDEPRTPVPGKEKEEELELDLESLGLEDREIPPEKITKLEKIGSGGFKDVFIGKFKGRRIAISEFRGTLSAMDIKELKLLGGFDHPNIVRFLGVSIPENTKETPVMIVSELCSNGDLFDYIRNVNAPSLHKVLRMMLDIASGLEYLHTRTPSVIHRDCKSSNILITAKGIAKIADFGLAKVKESTRSMVRSLVGTVNWQAPELWTAHPCYNHKVDVFSCAMVFWEMLQWHIPTKQFPWEGMNEHAIYDVVGAKKQRPSVTGLRKQWCPEIVDLIDHMWAQDPRDRPTMTEVVQSLRELVSRY